jgi:seryl-tRNA synthetase
MYAMWVVSWIPGLLQFLGELLHLRRKEPNMEPIVEGFESLAEKQDGFIKRLEDRQVVFEKALAESIRDRDHIKKLLGKKIGKLTREVKECRQDREKLQERIETLEAAAKTEKDYTHDRVHEFENFMKFLSEDLMAVGIEPERAASVLRLQEERHRG